MSRVYCYASSYVKVTVVLIRVSPFLASGILEVRCVIPVAEVEGPSLPLRYAYVKSLFRIEAVNCCPREGVNVPIEGLCWGYGCSEVNLLIWDVQPYVEETIGKGHVGLAERNITGLRLHCIDAAWIRIVV